MALKDPRGGRWWSRMHFVIRLGGLTGVAAAIVGLIVLLIDGVLTWDVLQASWDRLQAAVQGGEQAYPRKAILLLFAGMVVGLFWLFLEALIIVRMVAGRRSAVGFNAAVQIVLATALLLGVNLYSSEHYQRFDLTTDQRFTLPTQPIDIPAELAKLKDTTTILVYIPHRTVGQLTDKADAYDDAAERKVVEKVRDLAAQFHEFGPNFKVEIIDVKEKGYDAKFRKLAKDELEAKGEGTADAPDGTANPTVKKRANELRSLVEEAPENSIFFLSGKRVQRMSFNDLYQLDKTASRKAENKKDEDGEDPPGSNLVLLFKGVEPFARKALDIDQRRPRVGLATIHELLSSEGLDEIGHNGLKKALVANGIDVRDIMLKRENQVTGELDPAVYSYEESRYETLTEEITGLDYQIAELQQTLHHWESTALPVFAKELGVRQVTAPQRQQMVLDLQRALNRSREDHEASTKERNSLKNAERLTEQRRLTDLKAKLDRQLADIDLLILPRTTFLNVAEERMIGNRYHHLDKAQVAAIRDFLKAGKPVLACFGPSNDRQGTAEADELETLIGQFGIQLGKSLVLFDVEGKAFAARRSGLRATGHNVKVPPVDFDWPPNTLLLPGTSLADTGSPSADNPIRGSMKIAQRSVGKSLDLAPNHPRPVGVDGQTRSKLAFSPEIMTTSRESWNEDNPFPTRDRPVPHFEEPKPDDRRNGTFEARRRGPFPIAVALESRVPADWYADAGAAPAKVRLAVIGDGTIFIGPELSPAKERLLLNTCNWLLGRDELLPHTERTWEYPRVDLTPRQRALWYAGAWLGPPLVFFYLGLVVMFVRKLR